MSDPNTPSRAVTDPIETLLAAIEVLIDTPISGPKSAGTWDAAVAQARAAIAKATGSQQ